MSKKHTENDIVCVFCGRKATEIKSKDRFFLPTMLDGMVMCNECFEQIKTYIDTDSPIAKGKNKIPDITIKIDVNAKNPYATLRAEMEHARDIAKGEVPNQAERHFSRYEGMNEGEVASGYVYKKAQGKNEALNPSSQNVMNDGQPLENGVKYNQETINESTRTNDNNNIPSRDGNRTEASNDGLYGTRPSESNGGVRPFIRRSEVRSSDAGSIIHDPSPEFKVELEAKGKPINSYKELAANSDEGAASFIANFRAANEINGKKAAQVYEYSPE
jgi:hypothetical protein